VQASRFPAAEVEAALGGPVTLLGFGSFGDTWRYQDTAVKIICSGSYPPQRLDREVNGLLRVSSPYVVGLLGTRAVMLGGEQRPVLVFEYIAGGDVARRIGLGRWPSHTEGVAFLRGLLTGVRDMHAAGVVHRDIKPGNIALREGDWARPVLLDLGLARSADETTITVYPAAVGTARYMAPEQLEGRRARKAADLFAVGATVREVLGRQHPFYDDGASYTYADMIALLAKGPHPLPTGTHGAVIDLLDRLTAVPEHERGSASSSLRRLGRAGQGDHAHEPRHQH
jgi:eukaryotic-like serine/threonine-protein kinase